MSTLGDVPEGLKELAARATIRNLQSGRDGEWVTLEATTRGEVYKATLSRKDNLAPDAGARSNDNSEVLTREEIESFRRCSYSGEVLDAEGNTWVAYGTLCHGKLRLVVQTRADPLTIRGNIWGEGKAPPPIPTSGSRRMLGIEDIDVAEEAPAGSWYLSDEFTALRKNETSDGVARSKFARPVKNETDFIQRRQLLQSSTDPKYVELILWASEDRMSALNSMSEFIEQSILQVQYMQAAFDKTSGFNRPVKLIIKHFMRTAQGSSDPWGYTSFYSLLTFLNRGATWLEGQRQNPTDLLDPATNQIYQFDALMAITTKAGTGTLGYARAGSICEDDAFNVNAVVTGGEMFAGTLMAHEFGHTLGFMHDGQSYYGTSACDVIGDIMDPNIDGPEETYSQCSIEQYNSGTYRDGSLYSVNHACLEASETATQTCGNGIREGTETCDCPGNECTNVDPGCDGATCQFRTDLGRTITCSKLHDPCCDSTQTGYAAQGTVCRASNNGIAVCDPAETCSGSSYACPEDVIGPIGVKCQDAEGDVGACYNGECANRDRECRSIGIDTVYGGKWASEACYATQSYNIDYWSPGNPFHTFQEEDCSQKLWCAYDGTVCNVAGIIRYYPDANARRDGFPCSTAVGNDFPKICIGGVCTDTSLVTNLPPRTSPGPSTYPSGPSGPVGPASPPAPSDQRDDSSPPTIADGDDVSESGTVRYINGKVTLNGYAPDDMNVANKNALAAGLASYTQIISGVAGVTILDVGAARRRRLLSNHVAEVSFKLLLTEQDSAATIIAALDTSSSSIASIMRNALQDSLPQLTSVSVTRLSMTAETIDENFNRGEEDIKEYGGGLLAASITIVIVTPILSLFVGLYLGPEYRVGLATMVLIGENKYEKIRKKLFPRRSTESEHGKRGFFANIVPAKREPPRFGMFGKK